MKAKSWFTGTFLCVGVVAVGAGIVLSSFLGNRGKPAAEAMQTTQKKTFVKVHVLKTTPLEDRLVLTGEIAPWERITISAQLPGTIEFQGAEEGATVNKGEELFRIDTRAVRARMDQVRAHLTLANLEFERAQRLAEQKAGSAQSLDSARAAKDAAEADLRALEIQLNKSVVLAPFDGVVDKVFKKRDEFVDAGIPLVRLVQVHKVKAIAGVPERDVACFQPGNKVDIQVDAIPGRTFTGAIYRIAPAAEATTRTFAAEIELDNLGGALKPGMIARATFVRKSFPDAIVIPIFSVLTVDDKRFAIVEDNGHARMRPIEVGILQGDAVQVTGGISAGDRLIVVGQRDLRDGEPVQVQEVIQ